MIVVIGQFRLPVENLEAARGALERIIVQSRSEPGCIDYAYAQDVLEPELFRVSETWETREALTAHFASAHMREWRREREAFGMTDRRVVAYRTEAQEIL